MRLHLLLLSLGLLRNVQSIQVPDATQPDDPGDDAENGNTIEANLLDAEDFGEVEEVDEIGNTTIPHEPKAQSRKKHKNKSKRKHKYEVDSRFPFRATHVTDGKTYHYVAQASRYKRVIFNIKIYEIALYATAACPLWKKAKINETTMADNFPGHGFLKMHMVSQFVNGDRVVTQMRKTMPPRLRTLGVTSEKRMEKIVSKFGKRVKNAAVGKGDDVDMYLGHHAVTTFVNDVDKGTDTVSPLVPKAIMLIYFDDHAVTPHWLRYVSANFHGGIKYAREKLEHFNTHVITEITNEVTSSHY